MNPSKVQGLKQLNDIYFVGRINLDIFKAVSENIRTDEVVISNVQLEHIKNRHSDAYANCFQYLKEIIEAPDYIIEANKPNSAVLLKSIATNGKNYKLILRFKISTDPDGYKNSIITFLNVDVKDWNRLLKNKKILYKHE